MPGRINDEDIALVRERARIEDLVRTYVALKNAGGGSLKGLCPFHDEKTPSFQVTPSRGFFYCFGCGAAGDVISFLQKLENLSFTEAVEQLADKVGVQLRREEGGGEGRVVGNRARILEANQAAEEFFCAQLATPEALTARQFLDGRGFDRAAAERFGVGYAPKSGRALGAYLKGKGFKEEELISAGLIRQGGWDFFQGRVLWPIRDSGKSVLGFGARRLFDDDRMPAKYINTPETPVYKKSHVLYGLDLARSNIGRTAQAVVVEGYTDVMAAHLAGVDTAVASCGTAFGDDHARLLQRLMGNHDAFHGEVIFTFDGDEAGQKAALKVFSGDQNFISQTYVAVEPSGLDPCDLRLQQGDAAVRELVGRRQPLYRFVMTNVLKQFDLDRADGRLQALRAAAPLISSIRDNSLVTGYIRELAQLVGMDIEEVRREVARVSGRNTSAKKAPEPFVPPPSENLEDEQSSLFAYALPDPGDRSLAVERDTLKLMLQRPDLLSADTLAEHEGPGGTQGQAWLSITADDYTHPSYRAVFQAVTQTPVGQTDWSHRVLSGVGDPALQQLVVALSVEPLPVEPDPGYASEYSAKLRLLTVMRTISDLKSKLQRTNPVENQTKYNQMFAEMVELEAARKRLLLESTGLDA